MADPKLQRPDPREAAYVRACEGILRSHFGRRPCSAAARAIEQLAREARGEVAYAKEARPSAWEVVVGLMRRQTLRWATAAAAIALVVGLFLFSPGGASRQDEIGRIAKTVGTPQLGQHATSRAAEVGSIIHMGDRLETGDADKAEVTFEDGTTLRLNFNTVIEIPKQKGSRGKGGARPLRPPEIHLLRGLVWTKVQQLAEAPRYAVRTEAATAVARGTEFGVRIQQPASTDGSAPTTVLTVKEGAVEFSNSHGSVQATAMTESTATADSAPSQPVVLRIIKTFDLAPGKQLNVGGTSTVSDIDSFAYRMVYPQGWAGFDARAVQDGGSATGRRLQIVRVWPGSPAEQAGLAVGDVITRVNGRSVTNIEEVLRPVFRRQGSAVTLDVLRSELPRTASFVTTSHPYALPQTEMSADLAAATLEATWSLIEAECQWVIGGNQWRHLTEQFQTVLQRYPTAGPLHNNLAVWYEMNEQVGSAIQHLNQAIAAEPNNPLYHYNLSKVLASIGNFERWAEEAEKVVQLAPAWVPGLIEIAHAYSVLARFDEALSIVEAGLQANSDHPKLWETKGFLLLTNRRPQEALEAVLKAVELEPSNAQWWALLNIVYEALGDSANAEAASRKAVELDPGFANAHHSLAIDIIHRFPNRLPEDVTDASPEEMAIERWQNRPAEELAILAEAERYCRRAIELQRDHPGYYVDLGNILLMRGAVDDAEKILRKAMEMDPGGQAAAHARNGLAYRFAIWGIRLDEALQLAQQAAEMYPAGYILDTLAVVHFRRGEWDQAEAAWKKRIELAGPEGDSNSLFHLGKVYERKNQTAAAIAAYQEALRLRPDFPEASRALAKLLK